VGPPARRFNVLHWRVLADLCCRDDSASVSTSLEAHPSARRVVIFGNAGSGKTTLARRIAQRLRIDVLELDQVRWVRRPDQPSPPERCRELIDEFMHARTSWIVEGLHATLLAHALARATELHFLNPGFEVCRARALARPWDPRKSSSPERQRAMFHEYEPWFRSYEQRSDETSLSAHRALFDAFHGLKWEHTGASANIEDGPSDEEAGSGPG
jgi:adenylate kinase family enzyme